MSNINSSASTRIAVLLLTLFIAVLIGLTYVNYRFTEQNPGGNDFLVHWVGTRSLIIDGISPYSEEVALRIQTRAYGRPARADEHQLRVAYPLYSSLIFAPFAAIPDYNLARALWMTVLEVGLVLLSIFCARLTKWQPGILVMFTLLLFTMVWYHGIRPLVNGNAIVLVALFIAGALLAIRSESDELAGILLAFSTIKPQIVVLFIPLVLLWGFSNRRWRLILWTFGSLMILTVLGMFFIPDWIIQNIREVLIYPGYNPPGTPGAAFLEWWPGVGRQLGWGLTIVLSAVLLVEWGAVWGKGFRWFLWTASLTMVVSQWIGIQTDPGNFVVLILPLVVIMAALEERWGGSARIMSIFLMLALAIGLWALFLSTVVYGDQPQQHPIMLFPLPFILLIGLYWVRWTAIRPKTELLSALKSL